MKKADIIIKSNAIFDSIHENPFPGFVAIKGKKIFRVGTPEEMEDYVGTDTVIRQYEDKLVMAGFHDSHTHLLMAGMFKSYVNLADAKSEEESVQLVRNSCECESDKTGWVIGFGWYHVFWDNKMLPTKASLDAYFPNRPVFLLNAEAHGTWVNSKALQIAGITKDTPNPLGGEIMRDEKGEATGFLYESATGLVSKHALSFTEDQERELIRAFMSSAKEIGITSVNDVQPYFHGNIGNLAVYSGMDKKQELTIRIHAAPDLLGDLDEVLKWQNAYQSDKLKIDMVKQFLDGVSTTHTALMLEEYADAPGNVGISLTDVESIKFAVPEAHKRGLSVKLHSCGDKSARMGLDYYENAINMYGKNQCRHAIEHVEIIADEDIPRFGKLGVIPSVQPEHLALTQTFRDNPYPITLGNARADKTWPNKRLYDSAGVLAIGSDCPVVDNNPFLEIYRAVTRVHNDGEPKGGWNPSEKLSMFEILRSYTYGSAYGVRREKEMGTLEAGKLADIVVLDKNLFTVPPTEIMETKVLVTIMDGNIIFER